MTTLIAAGTITGSCGGTLLMRSSKVLQDLIDKDTLPDALAKKEKQRWRPPTRDKKEKRATNRRGGKASSAAAPDEPSLLPSEPHIVGLDFGKVIGGGANDDAAGEEGGISNGAGDNLWFSDRFLETPPVPGAVAGVAALVQRLGSAKVFVVSKARGEGRARTLTWLQHHGFYDATGLCPNHVFFTREKDQKPPVCRYLDITAFVDDSPDVLREMAKPPASHSSSSSSSNRSDSGGRPQPSQVPLRVLLKAAATVSDACACERRRDSASISGGGGGGGGGAGATRAVAAESAADGSSSSSSSADGSSVEPQHRLVFRWSEVVALITGDRTLLECEDAATDNGDVAGGSG